MLFLPLNRQSQNTAGILIISDLLIIRMVRWMCGVKLQDRVPSKELRERLGLDDIISYYSRTGCDGIGMCCEKKTMTG